MKEHQHIEWKQSWRDEYLKWICGFANAEGGLLIIGKNDQGQVTGRVNIKKLLVDIPNKVRDILGIMVDVNLRREKGKEYIEIVVDPYPYPVSYKGEYHYRSGSTKQELKGAALDRFLLGKQGRHWDGVPVPGVNLSDLETSVLTKFRSQANRSQRVSEETLAETDRILIERLHLMDGNYLKRAAVLLFHPDPERFVTGSYVKIGYFETDSDLRYHDEIHGDIFTQVKRTLEILQAKYLKATISYDGVQRVETWPVPPTALREALLNAISHKDYSSNVPIQISVYDNKLMLWNPGRLPSGWTIKQLLKKHASMPFNPDIANVFFRAGMVESWGRGIERIMQACTDAGIPMPELRYEQTGLWMMFPFSADEAKIGSGKSSEKSSEKILTLIKGDPHISARNIAGQLGLTPRAVEKQIAQLKADLRLKRVGPPKGGHWEVLR